MIRDEFNAATMVIALSALLVQVQLATHGHHRSSRHGGRPAWNRSGEA
jgi:hypothetical protein